MVSWIGVHCGEVEVVSFILMVRSCNIHPKLLLAGCQMFAHTDTCWMEQRKSRLDVQQVSRNKPRVTHESSRMDDRPDQQVEDF